MYAFIDSGAQENFISQRSAVQIDAERLSQAVQAHSIDGHELRVYGYYQLQCGITADNDRTERFTPSFMSTDIVDYDVILGRT